MSTCVRKIETPIFDTSSIAAGDEIEVFGTIYAGRDAALPRLCDDLRRGLFSYPTTGFDGAALLHTAVSPAGIGPTSSNKVEIEESFEGLCEAGFRLFLGKGALSAKTISILKEWGAVFAVVPPVTALLTSRMTNQRSIAYPELGMESLYRLEIKGCPAIVAAAHGKSLF